MRLLLVLCAFPDLARPALGFILDESFPDLTRVPAGVLANFTQVRCVAFDAHSEELHAVSLGHPPILTFSSLDGSFKRAWGEDVLVYPHGCTVRQSHGTTDSEIWVADAINNPDLKLYGDFTVRRIDVRTGVLLSKLGKSGVEGTGLHPLEYAEVTDVSWAEKDLFVTDGGDGDGLNERVSRLDGETYAFKWVRGNNGTVDLSDDPIGSFDQLHSVSYDQKRDWIWLADRGHNRVLALNAVDGSFMGHWPCVSKVNGAGPNSVAYDGPRDRVVISIGNGGPGHDHTNSFITALDAAAESGNCAYVAGPYDTNTTDNAHEIDVDQTTGDLYVAFEDNKLGMPRRYRTHA